MVYRLMIGRMTCAATHGQQFSHWVGLTLPAMIELARFVGRRVELRRVRDRASGAEQADIIGDLGQRHPPACLSAPEIRRIRVQGCQFRRIYLSAEGEFQWQ